MLFASDNKIFKKPSYSSYEERTFATDRYKLISDYIHLLEQEQFDEH